MKLTRRHTLLLTAAHSVMAAAGFSAPAFADDNIGKLETMENKVWGTATGAARTALAEAAAILRNQLLETGEESAAEVRFIDSSKLTLGANASAMMDEYVYAGEASKSVLTLTKGAFRFISGQMPERNMKLKTPTVTIGIRGTEIKIDVYDDGATELSTIEGAATVVSTITNQALDILAGHSVSVDKNGVLGLIRDFIHKSRDEAIERGIDELKSRSPIPFPFDIPNPFK